mmetsp:Transcript_12311/g.28837  ORF Transcript_12311/g.28837 Transcript_12311/m.28837 type:complete len:882 (-) Transcript_12311:53-2698(-)
MSTDRRMLEVLAGQTKCELRYFEVVQVQILLGTFGRPKEARRVFLCIGLADVHLVGYSLSGRRVKSIAYRSIRGVASESGSQTDFSIDIIEPRLPNVSMLFITSESRTTLLKMMAISYTADAMDRMGKTVTFPLEVGSLKKDALKQTRVVPFKGYEEKELGDYSFWLKKAFTALEGKSGVYRAAPDALMSPRAGRPPARGTRGGGGDDHNQIFVMVHIYDPLPLQKLEQMGRSHVRWLAMEYKQAHVKSQEAVVIKNSIYLKKMNLTNDMSAWICWELMLKAREATRDTITVIVLLRRQYVPPLMDTAQDIAITFKCPASLVDNTQEGKIKDEMLLHQCRLAADTFGPLCNNQSLYQQVIQAKLDALQFDEEAYGWIQQRLMMKPMGVTEVDKYALIFFKGILKMLSDENVLSTPDILSEVVHSVNERCRSRKSEADLDPMRVVRILEEPKEGGVSKVSDDPAMHAKVHSWQYRVARYFAFSIDGGILGSKFTLFDVITPIVSDSITQEGENKIMEILSFLLHIRPRDMAKPWSGKDIKTLLIGPSFSESMFNDRVMQVLVELGYIRKVFAPDRPKNVHEITREYAQILRNLLGSRASSTNLKASICRQIIAMSKDAGQSLELCPGLLDLLRPGGLFLATYATAALVNLSQANDTVKNFLIKEGIAHIVLQQLKSKDDDLVLYTLVLLVHLTKSVHHRLALKQANIMPVLNENLTAAYASVRYKRRIVTELCSVIGQMCNDDETRKGVCEQYQVLECLLYVFENTPEATTLKSKVLFALKQLCANSQDQKEQVGTRVIKTIVTELADKKNLEHKDWATNAIMLLLLLAIGRNNLQQIENANWTAAHRALQESALGHMDTTRGRIETIDQRVKSNKSGQMDQ